MRTTTSGLLLFLVGAIGLAGFLSGRLNDWLAYLFSPAAVGTTTGAAPHATGSGPQLTSILPTATPTQGSGIGLAGNVTTAHA